jgi:membrane protein DedA with SNARE-associated domain
MHVHKVETWFKTYGYWIVVANRFLAGTRAVVSFVIGMSELSLWRTTILSFISSLIWNFILLFAGRELGQNWRVISFYLETYGMIMTVILVVVIVIFVGQYYFKSIKRNNPLNNSNSVKSLDK